MPLPSHLPVRRNCTVLAWLLVALRVSAQSPAAILIPPGTDIVDFIAGHRHYNEFWLETGAYPAGKGACITRSHLIIRRKNQGDEPLITDPMQFSGDGNIIDGLTWDADKSPDIRGSDPGTLAIGGSNTIVRNCTFRNFRTTVNGFKILTIGRLKEEGNFVNTVADDNVIESCIFDNWGLREEPKGSTHSSACIVVGREDDKGRFTGTVIRKNLFINGPYKQYGYNAACKVFNAVLMEDNIFSGGQECMEMKYGNSTIRRNIIHHFSGYSVLANRIGRNSLYENNTIYDVTPTDSISSTQGFMIWECGNTVFRNNLFYDCHTIGRIPGRETPGNSLMEYLLIGHNTFINNKRAIVFDDKYGGPRHVIITRNIFYNSGGVPPWALTNADTASLEYFGDNLYYGAIKQKGDEAPVICDPHFADTAAHDYHLAAGSSGCGYGAFPCGAEKDPKDEGPDDAAHHVVLYPTRDKWVFHVGLVGLDLQAVSLEIADRSGRLLQKASPEPGFQLFAHIDCRASHLQDYVLRLHTNKTVIVKQVHIE